MVRLWSPTWVLLAALPLSGASPSVVTFTSSYTSTATTTITTSIPSVSITSTCSVGTVAPTGCADAIWFDAGNYWSATCTTSAYSASTTKMTYSWVSVSQCADVCTHYSNCAGVNWDDSETCRILAGSLELVPAASSVLAAELFLFNPCTSRVTSYVPETLTRTSTTEYTSLMVSTITPTPTPTPTPTSTPSSSTHLIPSSSSSPVRSLPTSALSSSSAPATLPHSSGRPLADPSSIVSTRSPAIISPLTSAAPAPSSAPDEIETLYSTIYTTELVTFFTECAF